MNTKTESESLLDFAHDGKLFHQEVKRRVDELKLSMNAFRKKAGIAFSTSDRWRLGSTPEIPTVRKVEQTLRSLEGKTTGVRQEPSFQHAGA